MHLKPRSCRPISSCSFGRGVIINSQPAEDYSFNGY
jgi:hypothetical protein